MVSATSVMAQPYFLKGPANPKPQELTAVKELADYLARRIDGKLTIGGASPVTFQVGDTELAAKHKLLSDSLPDEQWHIKSVGDQIILNGGGTRGVLYATYHFLEDYCGIHWWSVVEDYVPKASSLTLNALDASGKPMLIYRDMYVSQSGPNHPLLRARVRLNGCDGTSAKTELGGSFQYGLPAHCHTFDLYFPAKEYLEKHPEYFSLRNGKRVGGQLTGQLCVTNPGMRKALLEKLMGYIKKSYDDAKANNVPPPKVFDISKNDNHCKCECDHCRAEEEKYNTSGVYVRFLNELAAEVAKAYPDAFLSTLAYFYTEEPPKGGVKAADNVQVIFCTDAACVSHPYGTCFVGEHGEYYDLDALMNGWMEASSRPLRIWYYCGVKNLMPNASLWVMRDNARFLAEHNACFVNMSDDGHYQALRDYLALKLYWNPYMSEEEFERHMTEFLEYWYGPAAGKVREYFDLLKAYADEGNHQFIWNQEVLGMYPYAEDRTNEYGPTPIVPVEQLRDYKNTDWTPYYQCQTTITPNEVVTKGRPILDAAMELADTDERRQRVEEFVIEIDMVESYSLHQLLTRVVKVTLPNVFRNSCDAAVEAGTMAKSEVSSLVNNFRKYITDKTAKDYHEFNRQLAQKIYDSGYKTYRSGWEVPENVEELYLDNVPTSGVWNEGTWYRNH
jgi:hypothetical protein